ncbi:MAG: hypothetical protein BBJ60_00300 [Desulfobacterales bacterium S7086C20]|nr:MAG: hypothetical protein BBJ60_00300 [Desulfobacterales bacterium S7086C20]
MKLFAKIALLFCCIFWPASTGLSDFRPIVSYDLPADIMRVEFAKEIWIYRLYDDGTVKKVVNKRIYVSGNEEKADGDIS